MSETRILGGWGTSRLRLYRRRLQVWSSEGAVSDAMVIALPPTPERES